MMRPRHRRMGPTAAEVQELVGRLLRAEMGKINLDGLQEVQVPLVGYTAWVH